MSKYHTVSLPVKPHIKKYVETVEGGAINFSGKSMLCTIIRAFMQNNNSTGLSARQKASALSLRTASVDVLVHPKCVYTIGNSVRLTPDCILHINAYLQDAFERDFKKYIDRYIVREGRYKGYKDAIYAFADAFNIVLEEDISYDGLKQLDFRIRKKEENFFSKIVPSIVRAA